MLGETLRIVRVATGNIKQKEVANAVGVSRVYISEIEKGKSTPSLKLLTKLSEFYNIPLSQLLLIDDLAEKQSLTYQQTLIMVLDYYLSKETEEESEKTKKL